MEGTLIIVLLLAAIALGVGILIVMRPRRDLVSKAREELSNTLAEGVLVLDDHMRIMQMNQVAQKMLGLEISRVSMQPMDKVLKLDVALFDRTEVQHEIVVGSDVAPMYFELHARALKKEGGALVGWVVTLRDVTDYKLMSEIERRRAEELEALRGTMTDISTELELSSLLGKIVATAKDLLNASSGSINLINKDRNELEVVVKPDEEESLTGMRLAMGQGGKASSPDNLQAFIGDDTPPAERKPFTQKDITAELYAPLMEGGISIGGIKVSDIREGRKFTQDDKRLLEMFAQQALIAIKNARLFEDVQRLSITDSLTGLFNRRHFFELAEAEILRARRYHSPLSVIMLDIDNFKLVNDNYGHFAGDQVLQQVASVCRRCLRNVDVICRYGGEEFLIMLPETPLESAQLTAERLRLQVSAMETLTNQGVVKVTISLGVSALIEIGEQTDALFARADKALYRAKQTGRDRVSV